MWVTFTTHLNTEFASGISTKGVFADISDATIQASRSNPQSYGSGDILGRR